MSGVERSKPSGAVRVPASLAPPAHAGDVAVALAFGALASVVARVSRRQAWLRYDDSGSGS